VQSRAADSTRWSVAVGTGLLRLVVGAALWRWRDAAMRAAGARTDDRVMRLLFRYFAVRDAAVGVVTLAASRPGGDVESCLLAQAVADTTDAGLVTAVTAAGRLPRWRGRGAVGLAAGTAAAEYAGWFALRRSR